MKSTSKPRKPKAMYVVFNVLSKGEFGGIEVPLTNTNTKMCGMLPVFSSEKAAKRFSPKSKIGQMVSSDNSTHD